MLRIDVGTHEAKPIGESLGTASEKWCCGAVGEDGCIYGVPHNAERVLRFDPKTEKVSRFADLGTSREKWMSAERGVDGRLYAAPRNADRVLCIDGEKDSAFTVGPSLAALGDSKFNGGAVMAADGCIYAMMNFHHGKLLRVALPLSTVSTEQVTPPFGAGLLAQPMLWQPILKHWSTETEKECDDALSQVRSYVAEFLEAAKKEVNEKDTIFTALCHALGDDAQQVEVVKLVALEVVRLLTEANSEAVTTADEARRCARPRCRCRAMHHVTPCRREPG